MRLFSVQNWFNFQLQLRNCSVPKYRQRNIHVNRHIIAAHNMTARETHHRLVRVPANVDGRGRLLLRILRRLLLLGRHGQRREG